MFVDYENGNGNGLHKDDLAVNFQIINVKDDMEAAIRKLPVNILIRDFVAFIKHEKAQGMPINTIADMLDVHFTTVSRWIEGKTLPHRASWPGHTIYDYVSKILNYNSTTGLLKILMGDDIVLPNVVNNHVDDVTNAESITQFGTMDRAVLISNFVEVIKLIAGEYSSKYNGYEQLAVIFDCHSNTINNWVTGKTSPHSTQRPYQTIYYRIDALHREYGDKYDDILMNGITQYPAQKATADDIDNIENRLAVVAFCKALKHVREQVNCVSHKDLAIMIDCDSHTLYQLIGVVRGEGCKFDIPTPSQLYEWVKNFRIAFGNKYDYILNNRKHPEWADLLQVKEQVVEPQIQPITPVLTATVLERRKSSKQLTVQEAIAHSEQVLQGILAQQKDNLNHMAQLENENAELISKEKEAREELRILKKFTEVER